MSKQTRKLQTIDDVTGKPGGFNDFLKLQREVWEDVEAQRKARQLGKPLPPLRHKLNTIELLSILS